MLAIASRYKAMSLSHIARAIKSTGRSSSAAFTIPVILVELTQHAGWYESEHFIECATLAPPTETPLKDCRKEPANLNRVSIPEGEHHVRAAGHKEQP